MKRLIIAALSFFFLFAGAIPVIARDYDRDNRGRGSYRERSESRDRPGYRERRDNNDRRDYRERFDYRGHHGYRERPYDKHRHYGYREYNGHRYNYRGHWRSWDQWDRYARQHPYIYKHGRYYREEGHLMFRFCEPGSGACVFFSIGR